MKQTTDTTDKFYCSDGISLREYFDEKFKNIDKANALAYQSMEKRLEGMNEFRDTLKDQASKFVTRTELESSLKEMNGSIRSLEISKAVLEGKASQSSLILTAIISFAGLVIGIIGLLRG